MHFECAPRLLRVRGGEVVVLWLRVVELFVLADVIVWIVRRSLLCAVGVAFVASPCLALEESSRSSDQVRESGRLVDESWDRSSARGEYRRGSRKESFVLWKSFVETFLLQFLKILFRVSI